MFSPNNFLYIKTSRLVQVKNRLTAWLSIVQASRLSCLEFSFKIVINHEFHLEKDLWTLLNYIMGLKHLLIKNGSTYFLISLNQHNFCVAINWNVIIVNVIHQGLRFWWENMLHISVNSARTYVCMFVCLESLSKVTSYIDVCYITFTTTLL